jgi:beta-1,4-mannosyl-glycoprotein beta-1,4-N-acetylglucosaminyltransferase
MSIILESKPRRLFRRALLISATIILLYHLVHISWITARSLPSPSNSPSQPPTTTPTEIPSTGFLPPHEARDLCTSYELTVFPERSHRRKVYDLFTISTELDWLEIRLNELSPHVDYFVIVESTETFTHKPKPLTFKENYHKFSQFHPQIIYRALDLSSMNESSTWEREAYTRNALLDQVFPSLLGPQSPSLNDVILVSDVDEIPKPATITALRNCEYPERTTLRSRFYYYSFQWRHVGDDWHHPQATYYRGNLTLKPEDLRMGGGDKDLWNSSWHCSSCFSTVAEMATKLESFSHTEYNQPEYREPSQIVRRVRNGIDLFDREGEFYERVGRQRDVPGYVRDNWRRFDFMLDRDPANANFRDYEAPSGESLETVIA